MTETISHINQAVILAGGKGTRLGEITAKLPKPLIPVGDEPLLVHQIRLLVSNGIRTIFLATNHLADKIEQTIGDGARFNADIRYYVEAEPLGTTGAIKALQPELDQSFFVLYGDVMLNMNLKRMAEYHLSRDADATLALHPNDHPHDSDLVDIDDEGRITRFYPKPHSNDRYYRNLVNAGVYVLDRDLLTEIPPNIAEDFGRDVFPRVCSTHRLFGYLTEEYLKDMGTPDRLQRVRADHAAGRIDRLHHDRLKPAVFLDRDGVVVRHVDQLHAPDDLELLPGAGRAVREINQNSRLAVVATNQPAVARNLCSETDLREIHNKLDTLLGAEGAYLDRLYYCPHHPDRGYTGENPAYKIDCDCRKPRTGMLERAHRDLNIDFEHSYFIGDSARDIECAAAMGVIACGVRTGVGCKDVREHRPDFMFDDVEEAVDYLISNEHSASFDTARDAYATARKQSSFRAPFVVLIGGNSRSGKSTLARDLAVRFVRQGRSVQCIDLDHWLLPASQRTPDMGVLDRYQVASMERDLAAVLRGETVRMDVYDAATREKASGQQEIRYNGEDIVLVEGVVALYLTTIRDQAGLRLFCDIDQDDYVTRFKSFYRWKGFSDEEIVDLLKSRGFDEFPVIQESRKYADRIVSSGTRKSTSTRT